MDVGVELWQTIASAFGCVRIAKKHSSVSANDFRTPNVGLLLGSDTWIQHIDNGIRFSHVCFLSAASLYYDSKAITFKGCSLWNQLLDDFKNTKRSTRFMYKFREFFHSGIYLC